MLKFGILFFLISNLTYASSPTFSIGFGTSVVGEDWPSGHLWYLRIIIADTAGNSICNLSNEVTFDTTTEGAVPIGIGMIADFTIPSGANIIVYRSFSPIVSGSTGIEQANYFSGCSDSMGCPGSPLFVGFTPSNRLPNSDFVSSNNAAMPVTLQKFTVD